MFEHATDANLSLFTMILPFSRVFLGHRRRDSMDKKTMTSHGGVHRQFYMAFLLGIYCRLQLRFYDQAQHIGSTDVTTTRVNHTF